MLAVLGSLVVLGGGLGGAPGPALTPIVGGEPVTGDHFASTVVLDLGVDFCSGTLVDERIVLTAAHCLQSMPPAELLTIKIGNTRDEPELALPVERYALHPDFCGSVIECEDDLQDFAYVVLAQPALAGAVVPQLPLDQDTWDAVVFDGAPVVLTGFGDDEALESGQKRVVETTIGSFTETGLEFFAGGDGKDGCQGDSGGPAYARLPDARVVLVGVSSRGVGCGDGGFFGASPPALCWIGQQEEGRFEAACEIDTTPRRVESGGCCSIAAPPDPSGGSGASPRTAERAGLWALVVLLRRRRRDGAC